MLTLASRLVASSGLLYHCGRGAQLHRSASSSGCSWRSCSGLWNPAKTSLGPPVFTSTDTRDDKYTWAALSKNLVSPQKCGRGCCRSVKTRAAWPGPLGWELKLPVGMLRIFTDSWYCHSLLWIFSASIYNLCISLTNSVISFFLFYILTHLIHFLLNNALYTYLYFIWTQQVTILPRLLISANKYLQRYLHNAQIVGSQ